MPTSEELRALFSNRLSALLNEHNINQNELAKILGVSESTVGKWMLMKSLPRMGIIQKLSDYFGVPKSYFLEESAANKRAYYLDPETARLAQEVKDDPRYRALFDATRKLSPDAMKEVMNFIAYQSKKEEGQDND
ncbi:helix-turn-helix domain-containing protein [Acidaminococcus fermentans]|uniref:helix-turn-helix domain-containing protein n=1 Tax=Acidaminococcus fermentans TaxID=905 RepID=UPI003F8B98E9